MGRSPSSPPFTSAHLESLERRQTTSGSRGVRQDFELSAKHPGRRNLIATALLAVLAVLALAPTVGRAQSTIRVSPSEVHTEGPLLPGTELDLPECTVKNGSSQAMRVTVSLVDLERSSREAPPGDWFSVEPTELLVPAGAEGKVRVRVSVPEDTPQGTYRTWVRFHGVRDGATGIATAGALQVPFSFDVREPGLGLQHVLWAATGLMGMGTIGTLAWNLRGRRGA
jgi:hypothetical protein